MAKVTPITEQFQHFLAEMKETFWSDLYGQTKLAWQQFFELQSERQRSTVLFDTASERLLVSMV